MKPEKLRNILQAVQAGQLKIDEALNRLKSFPYDELGYAKLDTHRHLRLGFPEAIFCQGKRLEHIAGIVKKFGETTESFMATRADKAIYQLIKKVRPDAVFHEKAGIITIGKPAVTGSKKIILIVTAGTADIPVAEEAAVTAEFMGGKVNRLFDAGVAGVHRLLYNRDKLDKADVIIVVAGMEGALASVVGGLTDKPVISVPTSIGYGASFQGLSALLTMLNSCAPGLVVVNIDNGFGAGLFACKLIRMLDAKK